MYSVDYYTRPNGEEPVKSWLGQLEINNKKLARSLQAKLFKLSEEGLKLLNTKMLNPIKGVSDLYEVVAGQGRICTYYESAENKFVLLHGFLKKKQKEPAHIQYCCDLLSEYMRVKLGGN